MYSRTLIINNLRLIERKIINDHFTKLTKNNLLYRLFFVIKNFTINKIFNNVVFEQCGNCIQDDVVDGEFTEKNGVITVYYKNIFTRRYVLFSRCYILVDKNLSVKNALQYVKFYRENLYFVELPFSFLLFHVVRIIY